MTERMTTIPQGIEIVAERTGGQRVWVPEVRGHVYWPQIEPKSSRSGEMLAAAMRELTPAEADELKAKMAGWAEECWRMAQKHATHLAGASSLDEIVEEAYEDDRRAISDCMILAGHLYRASRGENDPHAARW